MILQQVNLQLLNLLEKLELLTLLNQKLQVQKLKAEDDAKAAEAKVTEAQAKVDTTTTAANEANTKLEAEKKEAADAKTAKLEAEEAKKLLMLN